MCGCAGAEEEAPWIQLLPASAWGSEDDLVCACHQGQQATGTHLLSGRKSRVITVEFVGIKSVTNVCLSICGN